MAITFVDIARESLRPIRQALRSGWPDAKDSRLADLGRTIEARGNEGIGTPIDDFVAAVGRRLDFQI